MDNTKAIYDPQKKAPDRWPPLKADTDTIVVFIGDDHLLEYCIEPDCPCEGEEGMCVRCGQEIGALGALGALSEACPGPRKGRR